MSTNCLKTADLERLTQSEAAWLVGRPTSWLRDRSDLMLRNADASYNGQRLVEAVSRMAPPVELSADDQERALRALELFGRTAGDESWADAVTKFLNDMGRRHGDGGLIAVLQVWQREWKSLADAMPLPALKSEAAIRRDHARRCETAVADAKYVASHEYLLSQVSQCGQCRRFRWGSAWTDENPQPELDIESTICWMCFGG